MVVWVPLCLWAETTVFCCVWPAIINNCLQVFCFSAHFLVPWPETRGFNFFFLLLIFFLFLVITDFLSMLPRTYSEKSPPCHGGLLLPFPHAVSSTGDTLGFLLAHLAGDTMSSEPLPRWSWKSGDAWVALDDHEDRDSGCSRQ